MGRRDRRVKTKKVIDDVDDETQGDSESICFYIYVQQSSVSYGGIATASLARLLCFYDVQHSGMRYRAFHTKALQK